MRFHGHIQITALALLTLCILSCGKTTRSLRNAETQAPEIEDDNQGIQSSDKKSDDTLKEDDSTDPVVDAGDEAVAGSAYSLIKKQGISSSVQNVQDEINPRPGIAPMLLDSDGLTDLLIPIFGTNPREGDMGFTGASAQELFTSTEKAALGYFRIVPKDSTESINTPELYPTISQDYLFALRRMASGICEKKIESEFKSPSQATNLLVKSSELESGVSAQTISDFMNKVFRYQPDSGLHRGAEEFAKVFQDSVKQAATPELKNALAKTNYKLICAYVVSDPRTYSR